MLMTIVIFVYLFFSYHRFRVKPPVGRECRLQLVREPNNAHDPDAVLVCLPSGKPVGRVPRELSRPITLGMQMGAIVDSFALYTGEMEHDGPTPGGGPKLCAGYVLRVSDSHKNSFANAIQRIVGTPMLYKA
jgi:hypothetical protein